MAVLSVQNLTVGYNTKNGQLRAVDDVSFTIEQGRSLGFVGESGCGKTTIGMTLMGLLPENASILQGSMAFENKDLAQLNKKEWQDVRGKDIAMIFQAAMNAMNPVIRVDEQIMEAIEVHHPTMSKQEMEERIKELFDLVDLPENRLKDYPHQYSGGMKQRAIIAMALACNPKLIIADEPTTALDVIVQDQILKEIKKIQNALDTSVIFISHDIAVVADVCEDICVMYGGKIIEKGTREEVFQTPKHPYTKTLLASYLTLSDDHRDLIPNVCEAPDLMNISNGCSFCQSCNNKSDQCKDQSPTWIDLSSTHKVFCFQEMLEKEDDGQ